MAKNRSSLADLTEGLSFATSSDAQEVQKVQYVQDVHEAQDNVGKVIGSTQGKKGQKLKRINMAFSDKNHEYITFESRRRGISATAFVNGIIDEYRNNS